MAPRYPSFCKPKYCSVAAGVMHAKQLEKHDLHFKLRKLFFCWLSKLNKPGGRNCSLLAYEDKLLRPAEVLCKTVLKKSDVCNILCEL